MKNLNKYKKVRDINFTKQDLIDFEEKIVSLWEDGQIRARFIYLTETKMN